MQSPTSILPRPSRRLASLGAALLLLTTCSGTPDDATTRIDGLPMAADTTPRPTADEVDQPPSADDPAPGEAGPSQEVGAGGEGTGPVQDAADPPVPQQIAGTTPIPDEVDLHEADLMLRATDGALSTDPDEVDGARYVTGVGELSASTADDEGASHDLELMAVDPVGFRPLTPEVTAQSPAVWERLDDGDVLVRHDVAHELGLELGGTIRLEGDGGSAEVRIGALAANGAPPFADVIVPFEVAALLGSPGINALVVSAEDEPERLADALEALGEVEVRHPPEPERSTRRPTAGDAELEPFTYTSRGDGTIAIHGDWVSRNIVPVDIPGMGTTRCHRAMVPQLYAALREIADAGLYGHFKPEQFGGCWVPRHILWNPDRGLSMHAWGLAIDFNVQDNWYGEQPQMDPRIVEIFENWGFAWGGHWSTPDGMHFELERIVEVP